MAEGIKTAPVVDEFAALDAGPGVPNYVTPEVQSSGEVLGSVRRHDQVWEGSVAVGSMVTQRTLRQDVEVPPAQHRQGVIESPPGPSTAGHKDFWKGSERKGFFGLGRRRD